MEITVPLNDDEADAVRRLAQRQGTTVDELASRAAKEYPDTRPARLQAAVEQVAEEDSELLGRLSR